MTASINNSEICRRNLATKTIYGSAESDDEELNARINFNRPGSATKALFCEGLKGHNDFWLQFSVL